MVIGYSQTIYAIYVYIYIFISPATMPGHARELPREAPDPTRAYPAGTRARVDLHTDPDRRNVYM